jgi:DNA gyrase inhibitor GyrI
MKFRTSFLLVAIAIPVGGAAWWLWANSRANTLTPRYRVLFSEGGMELRDYPPLTVVRAPMGGAGADSSFRKLFQYITGGNERAEKIAMTTPVLMDAKSGARTMGFIMPEGEAVAALPRPADGSVFFSEISGGKFAALRFPGARSSANETHAIAQLEGILPASGLVAVGEPILAYYDPPWAPLALRRNEVLIPVRENHTGGS